MSPDLRARVLSAARAERSPPIGASRASTAIGFLIAFLPIALFDLRSVALHGRPLGFVVLNGIGWAALAAAATWGAVGRGRSMLGRPQSWLLAVATLTPLALLAVVCAGYAPWPAAAEIEGSRLGDFICFDAVVVLALGPLIAFAVSRRRSDPVHPTLTGTALGVAAGAWGSFALAIHCPVTSLRHILTAHVVPVLFVAAVGALLGSKLLALKVKTK
jgi:hypothetical protein